MVEEKEDKSSMCVNLISYEEKISWQALKFALDVGEPLKTRSFWYHQDNKRKGVDRIMARLDRCYIANALF